MVRFLFNEQDELPTMNYDEEEFYALMAAVEGQGGEHLDKLCKARKYEFTGKHSKAVMIGSCGNSSLFKVPYEVTCEGGAQLDALEVCAVDDDLGRWPRFGGDRFGAGESDAD